MVGSGIALYGSRCRIKKAAGVRIFPETLRTGLSGGG
jgi:hypothetical protein